MSGKKNSGKHSRFGPETLPGVTNPSVISINPSPISTVTHEGDITDSVSVTMKISCAYHCLKAVTNLGYLDYFHP